MFTALILTPYETPFNNIEITTGEVVIGGLGVTQALEST
jgi:hypothetical protein